LFCSMWWTVDPDGFWVKAMQMRLKSVLPPISPLSLVPTPVVFCLSHFYRKHTCPLHFSPLNPACFNASITSRTGWL
jgi:hypothetical protein